MAINQITEYVCDSCGNKMSRSDYMTNRRIRKGGAGDSSVMIECQARKDATPDGWTTPIVVCYACFAEILKNYVIMPESKFEFVEPEDV